MAQKLNSIFDCSRMMTPEHKQRIIGDERRQDVRKKPELDAQEWELIDQVLSYSKRYNEQVTITLFDSMKDIKLRGIVLAVDQQLKQIKFQMEYDYDWIRKENIISVTT